MTANNLKIDNLKHWTYTTIGIAFIAIQKLSWYFVMVHTVLHSVFYTEGF